LGLAVKLILLGIGIAADSDEFDAVSKPTSVLFMELLFKGNEVTVIVMHFSRLQ